MPRPSVPLLSIALILATAAVPAANPAGTATLGPAARAQAKPAAVTPLPPNPDVILQGGDTCATATVIPSLPYTDSGSTVGYTNDYDEVCPYSGSTAPDVVYAYTPAADVAVDVTLCTGTTNYDTKLFVYQGTCSSGTAVACNDDACTAPLYTSPFVSSLTSVALTGGQTYYFVVDGYGGGSGDYTIEVSQGQPPPSCDMANVIYGQNPDGASASWNATTSGETSSFDYTAADNFDGTNLSIEDLHWWGLALVRVEGWMDCETPEVLTFDVRFFADDGGQPGTEVCAYTALSPTMTNTNLLYDSYTLYSWEVPVLNPVCVPTGASWVSIKSLLNNDDCTFLWMSGTGGDGSSLQLDTGAWVPVANDQAMCLTGSVVPVELQSFVAD